MTSFERPCRAEEDTGAREEKGPPWQGVGVGVGGCLTLLGGGGWGVSVGSRELDLPPLWEGWLQMWAITGAKLCRVLSPGPGTQSVLSSWHRNASPSADPVDGGGTGFPSCHPTQCLAQMGA